MTLIEALTANYGGDVSRSRGGAVFRAVGADGVIMRAGDQPTGMSIPGLQATDWSPCRRQPGTTLSTFFPELACPDKRQVLRDLWPLEHEGLIRISDLLDDL